MSSKVLGVVVVTLLVCSVVPATADILFDFDSSTYSLGALDGQDGWNGAAGATVVADPANPVDGGWSVLNGWNSSHALDQTYDAGMLYLSVYIYYAQPPGGSTNAIAYVSDSTTGGNRALMVGRNGNGLFVGNNDTFVYAAFTDTGWYGYEAALDVDAKKIVSATVYQIATGESQTLSIDMGVNPSSVDTFGMLIEGDNQVAYAALGTTLVPIVPEPTTMGLLLAGGLGVLIRRKRK